MPGVGSLWKRTASAEFWTNRPELCGNCTFSENFHTRGLGEVLVFCAVYKAWFTFETFLECEIWTYTWGCETGALAIFCILNKVPKSVVIVDADNNAIYEHTDTCNTDVKIDNNLDKSVSVNICQYMSFLSFITTSKVKTQLPINLIFQSTLYLNFCFSINKI